MWKRTAEKTINTVFSDEDNYPQNRKNNFVTFYNDLYIPLNSNEESGNESGNIEKPLRFKMKIVIINKKQTECRKQKLRKINKKSIKGHEGYE